jgi:hypothetical protein
MYTYARTDKGTLFLMIDAANTDLRDTAAVIDAFGGIRPMAHKLDVPVSTVQGWKQRNVIPENRVADILAAAAAHNVDLATITAPSDATEETTSKTSEPEDTDAVPATTPPPEAHPQPKTPAGGGRSNDRVAFLIAVVALIVALGASGALLLGGGEQGVTTAPGADIAQITDRLEALEAAPRAGADAVLQRQISDDIADLRAEISRIAGAQAEIAAPTAEISTLATRLLAVETKLDRLQDAAARQAQAAAAALSAAQDDIAQLRQQLAALGESRSVDGQNVAGVVGLALAAGRLQRALDNGEPYGDALATLRTLAEGDAAIGAVLDRLAAGAGAGVPTRATLAREFTRVARAAAAAGREDLAGGWTDRTLQRIKNTVSIRRIGPAVSGDAPDARVARAEAKLLGGDLSGAVAELNGLEGAAAAAAAVWLDGVRLRLDTAAAADELEVLAIARLQAASGGS